MSKYHAPVVRPQGVPVVRPPRREESPMPMEIELNGTTRAVDEGVTVAALLAQLNLDLRGTAVLLNDQITDGARHEHTVLEAGDRVEIVRLVGGG
jgi:thiamine biosynthesis protein ThiS